MRTECIEKGSLLWGSCLRSRLRGTACSKIFSAIFSVRSIIFIFVRKSAVPSLAQRERWQKWGFPTFDGEGIDCTFHLQYLHLIVRILCGPIFPSDWIRCKSQCDWIGVPLCGI